MKNMFKSCVANTNRKGFSLVELVVVILIIAILAAAIFLGGSTVIKQSRESTVQNDLRNFGSYVQDMFYANPTIQSAAAYKDAEKYTVNPSNGTVTYKLAEDDSVDADDLPVLKLFNEKYLTKDFQLDATKNDPWENPYVYQYIQALDTTDTKHSAAAILINSTGANGINNSDAKLVLPADYDAYVSAAYLVDQISSTCGDDYGVVILMIDGAVSTALYGFNN